MWTEAASENIVLVDLKALLSCKWHLPPHLCTVLHLLWRSVILLAAVPLLCAIPFLGGLHLSLCWFDFFIKGSATAFLIWWMGRSGFYIAQLFLQLIVQVTPHLPLQLTISVMLWLPSGKKSFTFRSVLLSANHLIFCIVYQCNQCHLLSDFQKTIQILGHSVMAVVPFLNCMQTELMYFCGIFLSMDLGMNMENDKFIIWK